MKTALLLTVLFGVGLVSGLAQVPEPVLTQLRTDVRASILEQDPAMAAEEVAKRVLAFETEAAKAQGKLATFFSFTEAELAAFAKGDPVPTDEEMKKAITEITTLLSNPKDLPKLLSFYETLRAGNKLAPAQRILHQRLCRLVLAEVQSHGEVTK